MKRFILLLLIITTIYCSFDSCINESDYSKCFSHTIDELTDFSCHLYSIDWTVSEDNGNQNYCSIYPDSAENQKIMWKIEQGNTKETMSNNHILDPETVNVFNFVLEPEKDFYGKGETIHVKKKTISEEDRKIINSRNTCSYQSLGRIYANPIKNFNLTDKNICFNTNQFPELKDLINCGYTSLTIYTDGEAFTLNTCYFIPDNHLPDDFKIVFKKSFIDMGIETFKEIMEELKEYPGASKLFKRKKEKGRKLEDDDKIKYEMIIEDKFGKKYKYTDESMEPEIIEEGLQGDKIYNENASKTTLSNINLLIFIISLILC